MANHNPLTIASGQIEGIPVGEFVSPAKIPMKQTEVDFGSMPVAEKTFTVSDADVATSSQIIAMIAYEAPTGKDLDEVEMDPFNVRAAPGSGEFTLWLQALHGLVIGKFKVNYLIG